jgi:hypothetical protein
MSKDSIVEMNDFEYTAEWFEKLKRTLKEGRVVRNPFAKFHNEGASVTIIKDMEESGIIAPPSVNAD